MTVGFGRQRGREGLMSSSPSRPDASEAHKAAVSRAKLGVPQSAAHKEKRRLGRLPQLSAGDKVVWIPTEEEGVVIKFLGHAGQDDVIPGANHKKLYRVTFGHQHRDLIEEVLELVSA